jgi:hypothetical protein
MISLDKKIKKPLKMDHCNFFFFNENEAVLKNYFIGLQRVVHRLWITSHEVNVTNLNLPSPFLMRTCKKKKKKPFYRTLMLGSKFDRQIIKKKIKSLTIRSLKKINQVVKFCLIILFKKKKNCHDHMFMLSYYVMIIPKL